MTNSDMKEALELERKIYEEMKAREDASRQREADETADMFNERELARLQAIIDDIAAHLTVDPERNMFYLKLGGIEYGAFIKPEDYMDDFPFMVSLRPIAEMKARQSDE